MKKIVYHVSMDIELEPKWFIPRIPKYRTKEEEAQTKRICVSPTIQEAIGGLPYKSKLCRQAQEEKNPYLAVYSFDLSTLKHLDHEAVRSFVPDAHLTHEHWILESVQSSPMLIKIKDLMLDHYNVYTHEYSGFVTELSYEKAIEEKDREEVLTFVHRKWIKRALKWAIAHDISYEILDQKLASLSHFRYQPNRKGNYSGSTKRYPITTIKFYCPKGMDLSPLWLCHHQQSCELNRHGLYAEAIDPRFIMQDWMLGESI